MGRYGKVRKTLQATCVIPDCIMDWFRRRLLEKVKDINRKSGEGTATCPFYKELDGVLGTRAACSPVELTESSSCSNNTQVVIGKLNSVALE